MENFPWSTFCRSFSYCTFPCIVAVASGVNCVFLFRHLPFRLPKALLFLFRFLYSSRLSSFFPFLKLIYIFILLAFSLAFSLASGATCGQNRLFNFLYCIDWMKPGGTYFDILTPLCLKAIVSNIMQLSPFLDWNEEVVYLYLYSKQLLALVVRFEVQCSFLCLLWSTFVPQSLILYYVLCESEKWIPCFILNIMFQ